MKIVGRIEIGIVVIPSTHVGAGGRHARSLAERLEQCILVQMQKQIVIAIKLFTQGTFEQLNF
jgi:hypothetical protein